MTKAGIRASPLRLAWPPDYMEARSYETHDSLIEASQAHTPSPLQREVRRFVASNWLVLVGDSSIRMLYHHLVALILGEWTVWPTNVSKHYVPGSCFGAQPMCPRMPPVCRW